MFTSIDTSKLIIFKFKNFDEQREKRVQFRLLNQVHNIFTRKKQRKKQRNKAAKKRNKDKRKKQRQIDKKGKVPFCLFGLSVVKKKK